MKKSKISLVILGLVLAFLYIPIVLVVVYGFIPNGITMSFFDSNGAFIGFTAKWYERIFTGASSVQPLVDSFWLSLTIAGLATLGSCVLGTTAALALHRYRSRIQTIHHALVYTPLIMPDILIGISLLMLFVAVRVDCGFATILIAHITFCVSYVVMTLLARLQDFDDRLVEAARDLGAGPLYTFFHVELPILMPGIVTPGVHAVDRRRRHHQLRQRSGDEHVPDVRKLHDEALQKPPRRVRALDAHACVHLRPGGRREASDKKATVTKHKQGKMT